MWTYFVFLDTITTKMEAIPKMKKVNPLPHIPLEKHWKSAVSTYLGNILAKFEMLPWTKTQTKQSKQGEACKIKLSHQIYWNALILGFHDN